MSIQHLLQRFCISNNFVEPTNFITDSETGRDMELTIDTTKIENVSVNVLLTYLVVTNAIVISFLIFNCIVMDYNIANYQGLNKDLLK